MRHAYLGTTEIRRMKKLLYQFDTDPHPAVFDNVVAYDGGADHVTAYGGITPANVGPLVDGAIFTRAPKDKKYTAIFVGGSDMAAGEALLRAVRKKFFAGFRVSVMLDSNGSNTTAAAGVAWLAHGRSLAGRRAVVLAGTGPVGQRAAVLLAREGCRVAITSRKIERAQAAARAIAERFEVEVEAIEAADNAARARALEGAQVALASGAAGVALLDEAAWADHPTLELLSDANATPPLGIAGIDMMDKARERHGRTVWGAIGFGALKIALHRACIARMFERDDLVLDAEEIYAVARPMVGQ
ncbi:MAG TPA: NADP-dependent methylenetetrahydromethanopterin/methylenetetrahydrofolate dehydrogenase [Ideonella sp.]|nr:NADP-dependent methylenetetrahydromethanopterin/methylenetetrahydrofolate dehydrogenase [Ideonella sp.]